MTDDIRRSNEGEEGKRRTERRWRREMESKGRRGEEEK